MELDHVRSLLARFLSEIGGVSSERVQVGATIDGDLQMESVAFVELQVALEEQLGIEIDPVRVVELNEFGAIADYLYSLVMSKGG
jgi:acyl carrier protein